MERSLFSGSRQHENRAALYAHRGQLPLDEVVALRAWLKVRPADGSDYLFTSQKGGRLDRAQFFRIFQVVAEAAGLPTEKRHTHCLKHSLASHRVAGNVNLALVKQHSGTARSVRRRNVWARRTRKAPKLCKQPSWRFSKPDPVAQFVDHG